MFSENHKELVMKGVVKSVQDWIYGNHIEIKDKRLGRSLGRSGGRLRFKLRGTFYNELPFERNDDVEIIIRMKNVKKKGD